MTGCGSNNKTLKCTNKIETDELKYSSTYEIVYDSDKKVKEVNTKEVITSEDESYLEEAKKSSEQLYEENNKEYGGYDYKITINGNTLTSKCTIDYSKMNVKKYVKDNNLTNFADSNDNVLLSSLIEIYKTLGAECEEIK